MSMESSPNVCVVDDDPVTSESIRERLILEGFGVDLSDRAHKVYKKIQGNRCDIVLCNMCLPDMDGHDLYSRLINEKQSIPPTIFITAHGNIEHAKDLVKRGATDFIAKPFHPDTLISKLKSIPFIPNTNKTDNVTCELGVSPEMLTIQKHLNKLSNYTETPLLITGESGVGKEVVARFLHQQQNSDGPFVAINCSAIPENLFESELFGHEKGAFTGATRTHKGVFEQAHKGTLLLDEIGDMPLFMQAKLLRVMQERNFKRVGGEKDIGVSPRLIFATNKDLEQQVSAGLFRDDLFFRINVVQTIVPSLRSRQDDILWLAERFLKEHNNKYTDNTSSLHYSAKKALLSHHWPGNVRELKHTLERACIMANNPQIMKQDIFPVANTPDRSFGTSSVSLKEYLEALEKDKIQAVLENYGGSINQTAEHLNISRKSLWEKMKKYNIEKNK